MPLDLGRLKEIFCEGVANHLAKCLDGSPLGFVLFLYEEPRADCTCSPPCTTIAHVSSRGPESMFEALSIAVEQHRKRHGHERIPEDVH